MQGSEDHQESYLW